MPLGVVAIVDQIKCEAKFAIVEKAINKLENNDLGDGDRRKLIELANRIRSGEKNIETITARDIPVLKAREFYERYINATIALQFSLVSSIQNTDSTEVDFLRVITNGTVSVPLTASNDLIRQSTKTFFIVDTFQELLQRECSYAAMSPNLQYPISGTIGIFDIVDTFIELNERKDLQKKVGSTGAYADSLVFTTNTFGTVSPRLVLAPPTHAFHLTMASLNSSITRKDIDTVDIGLSLPASSAKINKAANKSAAVNAIVSQRQIQVQNSIVQFLTGR